MSKQSANPGTSDISIMRTGVRRWHSGYCRGHSGWRFKEIKVGTGNKSSRLLIFFALILLLEVLFISSLMLFNQRDKGDKHTMLQLSLGHKLHK
jgi:hypothetical protein